MENSPAFSYIKDPRANTREQSTRIGVPWRKVLDTLGLLGEAREIRIQVCQQVCLVT